MNNINDLQIEMLDISEIKPNTENPRNITEKMFNKLKKSLQDFPEMLYKRPIVIDEDNVVLGGNMRLAVLKDLDYKELPVMRAQGWNEEQKKEFIVKDNVSFGEWDFDMLANEWDIDAIQDWGIDTPKILDVENDSDIYSKKINAPYYEARAIQPDIEDLLDTSKYEKMVDEINNSNFPETIKEFLKLSSTRHIVFNFDKIADYYAHSENELKEFFENNALVIIDFQKAIRNGYVELQESVYNQYAEDYE